MTEDQAEAIINYIDVVITDHEYASHDMPHADTDRYKAADALRKILTDKPEED